MAVLKVGAYSRRCLHNGVVLGTQRVSSRGRRAARDALRVGAEFSAALPFSVSNVVLPVTLPASCSARRAIVPAARDRS